MKEQQMVNINICILRVQFDHSNVNSREQKWCQR